jgi:hypothetical protein
MEPNVVWITVDSVRADHTTVGGYERDTTVIQTTFGSIVGPECRAGETVPGSPGRARSRASGRPEPRNRAGTDGEHREGRNRGRDW